MVRSGHLRTLCILAALCCLAFLGLAFRLVELQVFQHDKYRAVAEKNTQRIFFIEPRRGDILDAHGNPLAISIPVKKICANPRFLGHEYGKVAKVLAPLLSYKESELAQRLQPILSTNASGNRVTNAYVNLRRKVSVEQWQQITQAVAGISFDVDETTLSRDEKAFYRNLRRLGIYAVDDQQRVYPSRHLASHVIGFAQETEAEFNDTSVATLAGRDGTEAWFQQKLCGHRGWRVTEKDNRNREIVVYREQEVEPRPGLNVVLSIDMVIQSIVETHLAEAMQKHSPLSASAVVMRPRTGEILAMATLPDYDPNRPGDVPADHRRNRVISDAVEPGSTFKIVVVSGALNENMVTLQDTFDCERGLWRYMGKPLHDHDGGYPLLTVEEIIKKSSNIGSAKIAVYKLGEEKLYEYVRAFGFGGRTGITLAGEINGLVYPTKKWDRLTISRIPMGHSVSVTPLQMIMAMCAIANEGKLMRPLLVTRLQDQSGQVFTQYQPQMVRQVISPKAARDMTTALKTVVSKNGTAPKAALEHYTVAGKTGTAQKVVDGEYARDKYLSSFIGFFPADAPELCVYVLLDAPDTKKGYYGGQTAAPIFKSIAEETANYLKIRPDREEIGKDAIAGANRSVQIGSIAAPPPSD